MENRDFHIASGCAFRHNNKIKTTHLAVPVLLLDYQYHYYFYYYYYCYYIIISNSSRSSNHQRGVTEVQMEWLDANKCPAKAVWSMANMTGGY